MIFLSYSFFCIYLMIHGHAAIKCELKCTVLPCLLETSFYTTKLLLALQLSSITLYYTIAKDCVNIEGEINRNYR